ncbi:phosphate ABC transporter permease PstA [Spiroplasma endosymbiont of Nebria brevicollis]|uniref:phosphate ABC transporter permease PstA n=1 Tax=Spiroplasma endosymbiont of Nebria brevicollis TaxID=3066284 RepID=UPI00313C4364
MKPKSFQNFWHKITFNRFNKNYEVKNVIISEQKKHIQDLIVKITILGLSSLALIVLALLIGFVVGQTFSDMNFLTWLKMLGSSKWLPSSNNFGVIAFVVATFWVALISMLIAVPLSLLTSLFICEFLPRRLKKVTLTLVELLSGIPSVVFGAFGLMTIGPIFVKMGAPTKENMMTASFILSMMALPTIISLSVNAINSVPKSYRYASLALGISRTHTSFKVVFKAALPKIIGAVIFGFGRVIGETMAVVMIAGNSTLVPGFKDGPLGFIFSSVSTLAGVIGLEIGEAVSSQQISALYGIGLFLFIIVSVINVVVLLIYKRTEKKLKGHHKPRNYHLKTSKLSNQQLTNSIHEKSIKNRQWKHFKDYVRIFFMSISCFITMGLIIWIIGDIIINGIFNISGTAGSGTFNFNFLALFQTTSDEGYLSIVAMTCLLVLTAITIAMPLGIIGAIYLHEYSKNNKFGSILRFVLNTLASTPSIIFGMFGFSLFIVFLGMSFSAITAGLTLTIVVLPLIIRAVEDTLKSVPVEYREASLALGASKFETIRKVVIPNAIGGIVTSMILSMGRIVGESAPVYLTLGSTVGFPDKGFLSSGQTLTTHILLINKESNDPNKLGMMYQTALITVALIFILNFLAKHFEKSLTTGVGVKTKCSMELIKEKIIVMKNKHHNKQQIKKQLKSEMRK